ncbi:MAG TPA: IS200/IS605 family transposase [Bacteroidales bacterium]|nr:IS200/IS605 family transposase [Bacteroidales bacterium]
MSTYTQILYQLVFSTWNREETLVESGQEPLYKYISGILKNKNCHLYQVNGIEDHIHIVTHIHPSIAVATLIKDIKLACTSWNKETGHFKNFHGWQDGYGAFTYSIKDKDRLIGYVKNQKNHHKVKSFKEEYLQLLIEHGIQFEEKFLL